ncbi:unnamed protein product [Citrullus colocynthis]|uniref:Transmembrane protein n=1 Tax=Citrullus colocynthis TaxID=252529 RepID=A0ABP0YDE9_9ROSI
MSTFPNGTGTRNILRPIRMMVGPVKRRGSSRGSYPCISFPVLVTSAVGSFNLRTWGIFIFIFLSLLSSFFSVVKITHKSQKSHEATWILLETEQLDASYKHPHDERFVFFTCCSKNDLEFGTVF